MTVKTPLGHARGLGSAKSGSEHWWMQRVTAVALVPLVVWFVASIVAMVGAGRAEVLAWLHNPLVAILMVIFLVTGFYHLMLGVRVIIEDYVHSESLKVTILMLKNFSCILLAAACLFAVLKIALGS